MALTVVAMVVAASCGTAPSTAVPGVSTPTTVRAATGPTPDVVATTTPSSSGDDPDGPGSRHGSRSNGDDASAGTGGDAPRRPATSLPRDDDRMVVPATTTTAPVTSTTSSLAPDASSPTTTGDDASERAVTAGSPDAAADRVDADAERPPGPDAATPNDTDVGPDPGGAPVAVATRAALDPIPPTGRPLRPPADPGWSATSRAFEALAAGNPGASLTVARGGEIVVSTARGTAIDGTAATGDTPMVVASVSKLLVAVAVARLVALGALSTDDVVPWGEIGIWPDAGWTDVTLRELLDHTAGMPVERSSWFVPEGDCAGAVQALVIAPPRSHRGRWTYSNGNYCLLGLVVAATSGRPLGEALQHLVFDPVGASGAHLTDIGLLPGDMAHPNRLGVGRLLRLGGAGTAVVSTDDLATVFGRLTDVDRWILRPPGVFTDQYGFGHTGTIDGATACVWVMDGGDTVVSATVAGGSVPTGGAVCDLVVPAVAADLGIWAGRPDRTP